MSDKKRDEAVANLMAQSAIATASDSLRAMGGTFSSVGATMDLWGTQFPAVIFEALVGVDLRCCVCGSEISVKEKMGLHCGCGEPDLENVVLCEGQPVVWNERPL